MSLNSRIFEALKKEDTTTLKALRDLVKLIQVTLRIHQQCAVCGHYLTWRPRFDHRSLPFRVMDPCTFCVLQKMEKVIWKWCTVSWPVLSKKNGYPKENSTSSCKMRLMGTQLYSNQKIQKMWHLMLWREQWITSVRVWLELTPNGGVHLLPVKGKRE